MRDQPEDRKAASEVIMVQELCSELNIMPRTFRQFIADFPGYISLIEGDDGLKYVDAATFEIVRKISDWEKAGLSVDETLEKLAVAVGPPSSSQPQPATESPALSEVHVEPQKQAHYGQEETTPDEQTRHHAASVPADLDLSSSDDLRDGEPDEQVLEILAELEARFEETELRRIDDRDRLMVTLLKIQNEIQHLRYELVAAHSRRHRKRGLLQRLFGR